MQDNAVTFLGYRQHKVIHHKNAGGEVKFLGVLLHVFTLQL